MARGERDAGIVRPVRLRYGRHVREWVFAFGLILSCSTERRDPAAEAQASSAGSPTVSAATLPIVRIANVAPGRFLLEADAPVEILTTAMMEHRSAQGRWESTSFELQAGCAPPSTVAPRCRTLLPSTPFVPLSWNGTSCGPCCADEEPKPMVEGTYRLALTACDDGSAHWQGPEFDAPATTDAFERWRATSNVQKVSLFALDGNRPDESLISDERHVIGRFVVARSEVVLSESGVSSLIAWLRDANGFSNLVMPRCIRGKRFGFRLEREVPGVGGERSEVVVDTGCEAIEIMNQEGNAHSRSYTYFYVPGSGERLAAILREAKSRPAGSGRR